MTADYLISADEAGVDAVQLFDSWVGALNADDFNSSCRTRAIFGWRL
jgi:uroporphyrinogen-III decarboxylase